MSEVENYRRLAGVETAVEELRRKTSSLGEGFEELAAMVRELAEGIASLGKQQEASTVQSWLAVDDEEKALYHLSDLQEWLRAVWVHYDGAVLPECWAYHPGVVEELWVLMNQHRAVFRKGGTWQALADWHGRYRPGVVERVAKVAARCALVRHERGHDADPTDRREVPDQFDAAAIASAWTASRDVPFASA